MAVNKTFPSIQAPQDVCTKDLRGYIRERIDRLSLSPLLSQDGGVFPFGDVSAQVGQIRRDLVLFQEKVETPLKLMLMGEVKTGKSTLVNAILGDEVSPTDILEATSCIIEIYFVVGAAAALGYYCCPTLWASR